MGQANEYDLYVGRTQEPRELVLHFKKVEALLFDV